MTLKFDKQKWHENLIKQYKEDRIKQLEENLKRHKTAIEDIELELNRLK